MDVAWTWWVGGGVLGAAGLALLLWAMLADRLRGRRRCPTCWYDMSGVDGLRCPECGREVRRVAQLLRTRRRRRWAAVAVLLIATSGGLVTYRATRGLDWNTVKPVWWLKRQGEAGTSDGLAARNELIARLRAGRLSAAQIDDIVEHALAIQADPAAFWSIPARSLRGSWGDFIDLAWMNDRLTDEQVARYVRTAFDITFEVKPRRRIRAGRSLPVRYSTGRPRLSGRGDLFESEGVTLSHKCQLTRMVVGGQEVPCRPMVWTLGQSGTYGWMVSPVYDFDLPPGTHTIRFEWRFAVDQWRQGEARISREHLERKPSQLAFWTRTFEHTVEVVEAYEPAVDFVAAPWRHDQIRDAIRVDFVEPDIIINGIRYHGEIGVIVAEPVPVHLGFDVIARADGVERKLGAIVLYADERGIQRADVVTQDPVDLFTEALTIDLILRSSAAPAERTIDVTEIWDGEIVFENVPLRTADP